MSLEHPASGAAIPEHWPRVAARLVADQRQRVGELEGLQGDAIAGDPGEELAAFSAELDLLIAGSRSYGPLGRLFAGSTSNYLARHAHCPLLVLRRSARSSPRASAAERHTAAAHGPR